MRVTQIIDSLNYGGAQKLLVSLATAIRQYPDVSLRVISLREDPGVPISDEIRAQGVEVDTIPSTGRYRLRDIRRFARLLRRLRQSKTQLIHAHLQYGNILGTLAGQLLGIPVVASLHNEAYDSQYENDVPIIHNDVPIIRRQIETRILGWGARRLVAVGYSVAASQQTRFPSRKLDILPNAIVPVPKISAGERAAVRAQLTGGTNPRWLFISVGNLSAQKGYSDLLEAFARLPFVVDAMMYPSSIQSVHNPLPQSKIQNPKSKIGTQAALLVVGGGDLYETLQAEIHARGLGKCVYLLGPRSDVPRLLASSDLYVSASHWEGLPIALLEAMSVGLPVVATSVGDIPHIVAPGTGLVVPPKHPDLLANAIRSLVETPQRMRQFGEAAEAQIAKNYSAQAWAARLVGLYEETMGGRKK